MEPNRDIERLLSLYFEGRTSLEDELRLKEYFSAHEVPPHHTAGKAMFALWESAAQESCPAECFDAINALCATEAPKKRDRNPLKLMSKCLCTAAAAAAIIALIAYLLPVKGSPEIYCYLNGQPVTDIETARGQAQLAARLLSEGIAATTSPFKTFAEIGQTLHAASDPSCDTATAASEDNTHTPYSGRCFPAGDTDNSAPKPQPQRFR